MRRGFVDDESRDEESGATIACSTSSRGRLWPAAGSEMEGDVGRIRAKVCMKQALVLWALLR
jgi:hypothetical protein